MSDTAPPVLHVRSWHVALLAAWVALGIWLAVTGPGVLCDLGSGRRAGAVEFLLCNPSLLGQGPKGVALFLWFWSGPIALAAVLIRANRKRRA